MNTDKPFAAFHINATPDDLAGNGSIGRYILLPGSDGRAKEIAQHFNHVSVKSHPRGHHLYLGTLSHEGKNIDVASVSSGMGCPSMEIILHELFRLGGKRFLRVGTAGSLQPNAVKLNDIINTQASVRDESTTIDYVPSNFPAVASLEFLAAIDQAANTLKLTNTLHTGTVHCKSSLYAREFGAGPSKEKNNAYIHFLSACGILASEMETAALFIQSQLYNHELTQQGHGPAFRVLCGAILGIIATPLTKANFSVEKITVTQTAIELALETIRTLAKTER